MTGADATRCEDEADTGCTRRVAMYDMKNTNNSAPIAAPKVRVTVNLQEQGIEHPRARKPGAVRLAAKSRAIMRICRPMPGGSRRFRLADYELVAEVRQAGLKACTTSVVWPRRRSKEG